VIDFARTFHTGIRVPDIHAAMAELSDQLGVTWAALQERDQAVWTPETGLVTTPLKFTYAAVAAGWTLLSAGAPPEQGYGAFTYVRSPQGIIVEPVWSAVIPAFERWWAGGSL
jgi:hypothetical protein